jgi:cytochrome b involved in lipid metabolism
MSFKIILPIVLVILVILVGVGVYASFANLNPLKENKAVSSNANSVVRNTTQSKTFSISSTLPQQSTTLTVSAPSIVPTLPQTKTLSASDLSTHNSETDCYVSVLNKVYNVTAYVDQHPGGKDILKGCGKILDDVRHPGGSFTGPQIQGILKDYYLGELK